MYGDKGQGQRSSVPMPRAILDAGEESWAVLVDLIRRRIEELPVGDILEIVSLALSTRIDVPAWCEAAGHEILQTLEDGDLTRFWIRKGRGTAEVLEPLALE